MLAVIAARMSTASSPSRKTIIPELKTTVPWLTLEEASVGSDGPVSAVAIRYTRALTTRKPAIHQINRPLARARAAVAVAPLIVRAP
jgi:hypothetical protein